MNVQIDEREALGPEQLTQRNRQLDQVPVDLVEAIYQLTEEGPYREPRAVLEPLLDRRRWPEPQIKEAVELLVDSGRLVVATIQSDDWRLHGMQIVSTPQRVGEIVVNQPDDGPPQIAVDRDQVQPGSDWQERYGS